MKNFKNNRSKFSTYFVTTLMLLGIPFGGDPNFREVSQIFGLQLKTCIHAKNVLLCFTSFSSFWLFDKLNLILAQNMLEFDIKLMLKSFCIRVLPLTTVLWPFTTMSTILLYIGFTNYSFDWLPKFSLRIWLIPRSLRPWIIRRGCYKFYEW